MRHPLDFDALKKGDVLARAHLERLIGREGAEPMPEGTFRLRVLALSRMIEDECNLTTSIHCDGKTGLLKSLELLTDSAAAKRNPKLCDQFMQAFRRRLTLSGRVDVSNLSENERRSFEAEMIQKSRMYQAARSARRKGVEVKGAPWQQKQVSE